MNLLIITYNLNDGDKDYQDLFDKIEELGETWHTSKKLDSVWFVKTTKKPDQAYKHLESAFNAKKDNWVIWDITGQNHQGWMPKNLWEFIQS